MPVPGIRIASKANLSGWAILSHEFSKLPHRRDRRKKSPSVSECVYLSANRFSKAWKNEIQLLIFVFRFPTILKNGIQSSCFVFRFFTTLENVIPISISVFRFFSTLENGIPISTSVFRILFSYDIGKRSSNFHFCLSFFYSIKNGFDFSLSFSYGIEKNEKSNFRFSFFKKRKWNWRLPGNSKWKRKEQQQPITIQQLPAQCFL